MREPIEYITVTVEYEKQQKEFRMPTCIEVSKLVPYIKAAFSISQSEVVLKINGKKILDCKKTLANAAGIIQHGSVLNISIN